MRYSYCLAQAPSLPEPHPPLVMVHVHHHLRCHLDRLQQLAYAVAWQQPAVGAGEQGVAVLLDVVAAAAVQSGSTHGSAD